MPNVTHVAPPSLTPDPSARSWATWSRLDRFWLVLGSIALPALLLYFSGGVLARAATMGLFLLAILLPTVALFTRMPLLRTRPCTCRVVTGFASAVLFLIAVAMLRKIFGVWMPLLDGVLALGLTVAALKSGAMRLLLADLTDPEIRAAYPYLLGAIPALFALTWLAYEVPAGQDVLFYGLSAPDFGVQVGVTAMVKISSGMAMEALSGGGVLHYHWLYHALPAWLAGFLGQDMPCSKALVACNLPIAGMLFLSLAAWARQAPACPRTPRAACQVAGIVCFAPLTVYYYQAFIQLLHCDWFTLGTRNHLVLSIVNSMHAFGNNTLGVALCVLFLVWLSEWNRQPQGSAAVLAVALLACVAPMSMTLAFPMALLVALLLLIGQVRRPLVMIAYFAVIGLIALPVYWKTGILSPGSARILFDFDGGQFLQNLCFGLLPLIALSLLAPREMLRQRAAVLLLLACVLVPTFLYVGNRTGFGHVDLSMKVGTLTIVAFTPLVAVAYAPLREGLAAVRWSSMTAAALITLGLISSIAYSGHFAWYRLTDNRTRVQSIPAGYAAALNFIRTHSALDAVVIDPFSASGRIIMPWKWANILAERRQYLPTSKLEESRLTELNDDEIRLRTAYFQRWRISDFADPQLSRIIAASADYLVTDCVSPPCTDWHLVFRQDAWSVLQSTRQATTTP